MTHPSFANEVVLHYSTPWQYDCTCTLTEASNIIHAADNYWPEECESREELAEVGIERRAVVEAIMEHFECPEPVEKEYEEPDCSGIPF